MAVILRGPTRPGVGRVATESKDPYSADPLRAVLRCNQQPSSATNQAHLFLVKLKLVFVVSANPIATWRRALQQQVPAVLTNAHLDGLHQKNLPLPTGFAQHVSPLPVLHNLLTHADLP